MLISSWEQSSSSSSATNKCINQTSTTNTLVQKYQSTCTEGESKQIIYTKNIKGNVAEQYSDFANISMPFFAEGYINFGYIGILAFVFFLAWFCAYFDSMYWESRHRSSRITPYYLLLISSLLFVLRGDLMSSTAYTFATLFDIYVVSKISAMNQTCSERG